MLINLSNIDNLVNALSSGSSLRVLSIEEFSLGAACELAIWASEHEAAPQNELAVWSAKFPALSEARRLLAGGEVHIPSEPFANVSDAIFPIRCEKDILGLEWESVLARFQAALKSNGFADGLHLAIAKGLSEMADNVVQHSRFQSEGVPINGIAAYSVRPRSLAFTVADTGLGALETLRSNPAYRDLTTSCEALDLITRKNASRRVDQETGNGYKELFLGLARLNGLVRIRSGGGLFHMVGTFDSCTPILQSLHSVPGLQVSVECKLD
jgi:hypothetical protein